MSGTAVFKEAQSRPRRISWARLGVSPAFSAELRRGSGDKGSLTGSCHTRHRVTPIRRQPQTSPRDSRRAFASCESRHGTRFQSPQRGCAISPVGGVPSSLFYLESPMKSGRSLVELAQELERQLATKKDMVVPSSLMLYRTSVEGVSSVEIEQPT